MKRRRFIQSLVAAPAAPVLAQQANQPQPTQQPQPSQQPAAVNPGFGGPREIPKIDTVPGDEVADPAPRFFSERQLASLRKFSETAMPPADDSPGALDAGVPEFLDFMVGESPAETQQLYEQGLVGLEASAQRHFGKSFAELNASQIDAILQPLLAPWTHDPLPDPSAQFFRRATEDIRTATMNSREWSLAEANSGQRGGRGRRGQYVEPIDPIA